MIRIDIPRNEGNCNERSLCIITYRPYHIPHVCIDKPRIMHYDRVEGILRSNIEYGCKLINEKNIGRVLQVYEYVFEFSYLMDTHRLSSLANSLVGFRYSCILLRSSSCKRIMLSSYLYLLLSSSSLFLRPSK